MRRAYLFTNHSPLEIVSGYGNIQAEDSIIAVDKGLEYITRLGLRPSIVIGDLDSISTEILDRFPELPALRHPAEKNETDTELALQWCVEQGFSEIVICNDLLGRFDHALALVQNLLLLKEQSPDVLTRIESKNQTIFILDKRTELSNYEGRLLSLIALNGTAEFSLSKGLKYPLHGLVLYPHLSRGISNEITETEAEIGLAAGTVLAIITQ
jgi:thiamine pyrophosphokinase